MRGELAVLLLAAVLLVGWALWRRRGDLPRRLAPLAFISVAWLVQVAVQGGDNMVGGRILIPALPLVYVALAGLAREIPFAPAAAATRCSRTTAIP